MRRGVEEYVKQCKSCQVNKILTPKHKATMEITTTAERPFEKRYLYVEGNKYIRTFQDDLSKYVVAVPIGKRDAETVVRAFVEKIVLRYGTSQTLKTDQRANFVEGGI